MRNNNKFDFIFGLSGLPVAGSGGTKIVIAMVNGLSRRGLNVGILSLRRAPWMKIIGGQWQDKPYLYRKILDVNDSSIGYRIINPLLRRILHAFDYGNFSKGIKIILEKDLKKIEYDILVATNFQVAKQLVEIGEQTDRIILFSQVDETDERYSGKYAAEAADTYSMIKNKIFINSDMNARFPGSIIIPMGIDIEKYKIINPIELRDDRNVLFILREGAQKDPETALKVIGLLHMKDRSINISAFGNLDEVQVPDYVNYAKMPSNNEMLAMMNKASVFVITSVLEGYPLPPLEAMSSGCCVVAVDNAGIREYLVDGVNGIISPPRDPETLTDRILKAVYDHEMRISLAKNGNSTAMMYTYERMVNEFIRSVYKLRS